MTSTAQAYEWVKTRHWSLRQFREWFDAQRTAAVGQDTRRAWVEPREWRGLTDDERNVITRNHAYVDNIIKATEAKLKEKNNGT